MVTRRTYPLAGKESVDVDVCGARATPSGHVATYAAKLASGATPADAVALVPRIDRMRSRRHHRMLRALLRLPDGNGRDDPFGLHLRPVTDALILDWQGSPHLMEINARDGETGHASGDA